MVKIGDVIEITECDNLLIYVLVSFLFYCILSNPVWLLFLSAKFFSCFNFKKKIELWKSVFPVAS